MPTPERDDEHLSMAEQGGRGAWAPAWPANKASERITLDAFGLDDAEEVSQEPESPQLEDLATNAAAVDRDDEGFEKDGSHPADTE